MTCACCIRTLKNSEHRASSPSPSCSRSAKAPSSNLQSSPINRRRGYAKLCRDIKCEGQRHKCKRKTQNISWFLDGVVTPKLKLIDQFPQPARSPHWTAARSLLDEKMGRSLAPFGKFWRQDTGGVVENEGCRGVAYKLIALGGLGEALA